MEEKEHSESPKEITRGRPAGHVDKWIHLSQGHVPSWSGLAPIFPKSWSWSKIMIYIRKTHKSWNIEDGSGQFYIMEEK